MADDEKYLANTPPPEGMVEMITRAMEDQAVGALIRSLQPGEAVSFEHVDETGWALTFRDGKIHLEAGAGCPLEALNLLGEKWRAMQEKEKPS